MAQRDIGLEILPGLQEIRAGKDGLRSRKLRTISTSKEIRARLGLSQSAFAGLMGVSLRTVQDWEQGRREPSGPAMRTVQDWEQGRREPSGPAKTLLRIAEQHPDVLLKLA